MYRSLISTTRRPASGPLRVRLETEAFEGVCDNLSEAGVFFTSPERLRVRVELEGPDGTLRVLSGHLVRVWCLGPSPCNPS